MPIEDADHGLTPREWLDSDPVPLTPDVDLSDPEQRIAWIRANNEENYQRSLELAERRERRTEREERRAARRGTTTVVAVRLLHVEHRALVRAARRESVTVSDLVRRWVRAGLDPADAVVPEVVPELVPAADRQEIRRAVLDAADATVARITDELRRLREIVVGAG